MSVGSEAVETSGDVWPRFREAAERYCSVIESASEFPDADSFYAAVAEPLANLYAAGLALPWVKPTDDEIEIEWLNSDEWWKVFRSIDALTASDDPYRTVFNPQEDTDIVEGPLADDLADVYRDVVPAARWDDHEHVNDLLWYIRLWFQDHWGRHAVEALRVIQWRRRFW